MSELTEGVSWVAVVVGFVASFLLGWIWYNPKVFGTRWAKGVGVSLEDSGKMPVAAMVTQALTTFGLSWLIGITAASNALGLALLIIVTIELFIVSNGKFAQKSNDAISIEAGYILAMGFIMIVCQAIW